MKSILASLFALCLVSGCGNATSEHPLSDESDTILDERLIGWWSLPPNPEEPGPDNRFAIGRLTDKVLHMDLKNALEIAYMKIEGNGVVKVIRLPFYTTKIGDKYYASAPLVDEKGYTIFRYDIQADKLIVDFMNMDAVAALIDSKQVAGAVTREKKTPGNPPELIRAHLTLSKEKLKGWIPTAPAKVWERMTEPPLKIDLNQK